MSSLSRHVTAQHFVQHVNRKKYNTEIQIPFIQFYRILICNQRQLNTDNISSELCEKYSVKTSTTQHIQDQPQTQHTLVSMHYARISINKMG